jgi:hypothetical protein
MPTIDEGKKTPQCTGIYEARKEVSVYGCGQAHQKQNAPDFVAPER